MYRVYCDDYLIHDTYIQKLKVLNASVELELNKTGSFSFIIYNNNPHYDKLQKLKSIITVYHDDYLLFRGRILNEEEGFHNEKQVTCEGELAFLLDSIQRPYEFQGTPGDLFRQLIESHNAQVDESRRFIVGRVTVTDPNDYINRSDSTYLNTWESVNKKLIEGLGGYLWVRHENDGTYIDYLADFETLSSQTIEFGKNLLDLNKIIKGENIATAIIPLGAKLTMESEERLTIVDVNNGYDYVYDSEAVEKYGWIYKTVTWNDVTLPENLLRKAKETLADSINLLVSIELNALDLATTNQNVNSFRLGTYIKVKSSHHGLSANFLVKKLYLDLNSPKANKLTLGTSYASFTEQTTTAGRTQNDVLVEIKTNVDSTTTALQNINEQTSSKIAQTSEEILSTVAKDYYLKAETDVLIESVNTKITQTDNTFEFQFNQFSQDFADVSQGYDAKFNEISKYIRFVDGNIILGESGNELTLKIQNDRISFFQNGVEVAYFSNRKMYVTDGEFLDSMTIGKFRFIPRKNGNLSFKVVK